MNETPFNPLPLPDNLMLAEEPGKPLPPPVDGPPKPRKPRKRKQPPASMKTKCQARWEKLKTQINTRLGQLDKQKLKELLLACGIAAGVVLAIIAALKLVPIAALLLAILGLYAVIRLWDRLRDLRKAI